MSIRTDSKRKVRSIKDVKEEGFSFYLVLQYVAHFFTKIMKCQSRNDSPSTLIKYSRDWEYPWVLIRSDIQPGHKVLDCGAGYSPTIFLWSKFGAEVHAIDKDIRIASKFRQVLHCLKSIIVRLIRFPLLVLQKKKGGCSFYALIFRRNWQSIKRIWRGPTFWGPVSPKLLKRYKVNYQNGDLTNLPFQDEYFDVVSCVSVLEHLLPEDRIKGIKEMARVVKKGGKLIITYDKYEEDQTELFIKESNMMVDEIVYFLKPDNLYDKNKEKEGDTIGISLIK